VVTSPRPYVRCWPAALAAVPGLVLLALVWALFLGFAPDMAADTGSAVFLRGLVALQAVLVVGCAVLIRPRPDRLFFRPVVLPGVIWLLFVLDAMLLAGSGIH